MVGQTKLFVIKKWYQLLLIISINKYNLGAYQLIFDETIGIKHAVILSIHAWNYKM